MTFIARSLLEISLLTWGLSACGAGERCGNGVVDAGEACDDGNLSSADGCSAACEPDDDERLPGDERAGYFVCRIDPLAPGVTCGPGTVCCTIDQPICVSAEQGCTNPLSVVSCDGPEDCERADYHCETLSHGTSCTSSEGSITWCHTDADCVAVFPWLADGVCASSGACDFSAGAVSEARF